MGSEDHLVRLAQGRIGGQGLGFEYVNRRAAQLPRGQWVVGFKYDDTKTAEGRPITRDDLDQAAPDHPVYINHRGGHGSYVNSLALQKADVNKIVLLVGFIFVIFLLDIIEHLHDPEAFMEKLRHSAVSKRPEIVMTTANVAFFITRWMLFLGHFNYGRKGILDRTHTRLFTFASLEELFAQTGYQILDVRGIVAGGRRDVRAIQYTGKKANRIMAPRATQSGAWRSGAPIRQRHGRRQGRGLRARPLADGGGHRLRFAARVLGGGRLRRLDHLAPHLQADGQDGDRRPGD